MRGLVERRSSARGDFGARCRKRKLSAWREMQGLESPAGWLFVGLLGEMDAGTALVAEGDPGGVAKASLVHSTSIGPLAPVPLVSSSSSSNKILAHLNVGLLSMLAAVGREL